MEVRGRHGADLRERWSAGASTHLGVTVSGFPNLFFLAGPSTGLGPSSLVFMIECQIRYVLGALGHLERTQGAALELRPDVERASYAEVQRRLRGTTWASGCRSWYQRRDGRIDVLWPGTTVEYWWRSHRFDPDAFEVLPAPSPAPVPTSAGPA
jgi:hypothetical protein